MSDMRCEAIDAIIVGIERRKNISQSRKRRRRRRRRRRREEKKKQKKWTRKIVPPHRWRKPNRCGRLATNHEGTKVSGCQHNDNVGKFQVFQPCHLLIPGHRGIDFDDEDYGYQEEDKSDHKVHIFSLS